MNTNALGGNWVDLIIIVILVYYVSEAWRVGLWAILSGFLAFLLSLFIALRAYPFTAELLRSYFSLSHSFSNALGFLLSAAVIEGFFSFLFAEVTSRMPNVTRKRSWDRALAVFPALGEGLIMITFLITLLMGLPISPQIKEDVSASKIGGTIMSKTTRLEKSLHEIFGGVIEDSLTYLIVKPESKESIPIQAKVGVLEVNEATEREMFQLVNEERTKRGIAALVWRDKLVPVARAHAKDMWERRYFSHYSPEGKDVGDRLSEASVSFQFAGENLALAPTLATAHEGLMNSEGHRANILEPKFKQMGIGVIDNGFYGKMFVQIFTD